MAAGSRPPLFLFPRFRRSAAVWNRMLRDREIRVVSGPPGEPYAVTVLTLSGKVIVQLEERFWRDTPGPLRESAIRAHAEHVREEFGAIDPPAKLVASLVEAARAAALILGIAFTLAQRRAIAELDWMSIWYLLWPWLPTAAAWLIPPRHLFRLARPLMRRLVLGYLLRRPRI